MATSHLAKSIAIALVLATPVTVQAQRKPGPYAGATAGFLVGRWGDNGDCSKDVVIRADGTFRSYTGGEGTWRLDGNRLIFSGPNGEYVMWVVREGPNVMIITNPDGSVGRSQRC